jgi:uncharacterized protein (TIGR02996 family)
MHPELRALLRNARRQPEDDPARLVLADWLEEHGDEQARARAEFIRVQVRLARLHRDDPLREGLTARANEVQQAHEGEWLGPVARLPGVIRVDCAGGLVRPSLRHEAVAPWLEEEVDRLPVWPWVDGFHLIVGEGDSGWHPDEVRALLDGPCAEGRGYLHLAGRYLGEGLADALADSPGLEEVTCLDLSASGMDQNFLEPLLASPHLANLLALRMDNTHAGGSLVGLIAGSTSLPGLERLDLYNDNLGAVGVERLGQAPLRLSHLGLALNNLGAGGVEALLATPHVPHLRSLDLWGNGVGDRGAERLAASPGVVGLERLSLACNGIGDRGARALAVSPYLAGLTDLHIGLAAVSETARRLLRGRFGAGVR